MVAGPHALCLESTYKRQAVGNVLDLLFYFFGSTSTTSVLNCIILWTIVERLGILFTKPESLLIRQSFIFRTVKYVRCMRTTYKKEAMEKSEFNGTAGRPYWHLWPSATYMLQEEIFQLRNILIILNNTWFIKWNQELILESGRIITTISDLSAPSRTTGMMYSPGTLTTRVSLS